MSSAYSGTPLVILFGSRQSNFRVKVNFFHFYFVLPKLDFSGGTAYRRGMTNAYVFRTLRPLVLASGSPRRREFLRKMGIEHRVLPPPDTAEPVPEGGEAPATFAARAALLKAEAVARILRAEPEGEPSVVLGADTVVVLKGAILGKPRDAKEAFSYLRRLAGREHRVITACALCLPDGTRAEFAADAAVDMAPWPDEVLRAYAATGEGLDKAGGYAVQGVGSFLTGGIRGSWSAVVGLPVAETTQALLRHNVIAANEA